MSAADLLGRYKMFGEDPFVVPSPEAQRFSAWEYAAERCEAICGGASKDRAD
ncbi:MAG TPA: hypothetical protein VMV46_07310 [Thermoanaerobaculia bacterium]|nr:hypothetical protein [Thermoanaerobaculia bacterium]